MYPILFKIPVFGLFGLDSIPIHSYGLMVALGFLAGSWYVKREAMKAGEDPISSLPLFWALASCMF